MRSIFQVIILSNPFVFIPNIKVFRYPKNPKHKTIYIDKTITQHYCCVMIPALIDIGGDWNVLPPGIHNATLENIEKKFASNNHRKLLFDGLKKAVKALSLAGCKTIYLDGSFVTAKTNPGDWDMCWSPVGVDVNKLDPILLDFTDKRKNQKTKFMGECFPSSIGADAKGTTFLNYFQKDRITGKAKGIIRLQL